MNQVIYIVGLVVIVIALLSFFGLRWSGAGCYKPRATA